MMRRSNPARGHTLVEFAIAMALGLLVTVGAVSLYTTQRSAFDHASDAMRIREAGLIALTLIGQQLQMAGFVPADVSRYNSPHRCSGALGADRPAPTIVSPARACPVIRTVSRSAMPVTTSPPGHPPAGKQRTASVRP